MARMSWLAFYTLTIWAAASRSPTSSRTSTTIATARVLLRRPAGWDYNNSYTVVVSKSAFGAAGFGSVIVPAVHDSPPKIGSNNLITPTNCTPCVVNVAVATGTAGATTLTATDSAQVCFGTAT